MNYPEYYYAYEILYWCGLRQGEMFALTMDDVDLDERVIHVTKTYHRVNKQDVITTPKTPSSIRKVNMPAFLCDELSEYIAMLHEPSGDQRLFFALNKSNLTQNFHSLITEAGLKRITVHGLIHSHVSLLISKKYDIFEVSKRIGHKSVKRLHRISTVISLMMFRKTSQMTWTNLGGGKAVCQLRILTTMAAGAARP